MKAGTKKRINTLLIVIFLAAVAYLYACLYLLPSISGARKTNEVINYGKIERSNEASCLIIRNEEVIYAQQGGTLSYYCEEGSKTRVGTKVLDIYPAGRSASPYYCPSTGFVSYYIDGYEDVFNIDEIIELEPEYIDQTMIAPEDTVRKTCEKDDPVYKLITGDEWYMVLAVDKSFEDDYTIGQNISVCFGIPQEPEEGEEAAEEKEPEEKAEEPPAEETEIPAVVTGVFKKESGLLVAARTRRYYEGMLRTRFSRVRVITRSEEGLMVPKSAVTEEEGRQGVYKLGVSGDYSFVPIETVTENEEYYIVKSDTIEQEQPDGTKKSVITVGIYDEILLNAEEHQ